MAESGALRMLEFECRALLTRLDLLEPFAVLDPMVTAAAPSGKARMAVDRYLSLESGRVRRLAEQYLHQLGRGAGGADEERQCKRLVFLRMRFNGLLADLDTFGDVLTQRSQTKNGVWLAGLDVAASDGLSVPGLGHEPPPVMCYLDRGHGAAIRRARTRLVTGENPVAIVRIPRERMVGGGIGSSLMHEVGHQAVALLNLLPSLRAVLQAKQLLAGAERRIWRMWDLWISEIAADFWAVAQLGITATFGLMSVVSLPRVFVFRVGPDDPHPVPWIRVLLSCALGNAMYPHPEWAKAGELWKTLYPLRGLDADRLTIFQQLEGTIPELVRLLIKHRPPSLRGKTIPDALQVSARLPARLRKLYAAWRSSTGRFAAVRPTLALAVLGQARADGRLGPEIEARILERLFRQWALQRARREALPAAANCGGACRCTSPKTLN